VRASKGVDRAAVCLAEAGALGLVLRFSKLEKCVYPGRKKNHNILNEALKLGCSQLESQ